MNRGDRVCKLCQSNEVEDEIHFLFNCPALEPTRAQFIHSITLAQPNFVFNTPTQQINYLYFNEHLSNNILDISANMLSVLYEKRNKLIAYKEDLWRCELVKPTVIKFTRNI